MCHGRPKVDDIEYAYKSSHKSEVDHEAYSHAAQ